VHEYSLGLIVGVMANRKTARTYSFGHPPKKAVPGPARCLLDGEPMLLGKGWHISTLDGTRQSPVGSKGAHSLCVGIGFLSANTVVEMGHMKLKLVVGFETVKGVQQAQRIRSAGYADHDGLAW
jgi:hypothetical protein